MRDTARTSRRSLSSWFAPGLLGLGLVLAAMGAGDGARAQEPPIKSAQDAACRNEARGRVFATPDPRGLGPHAIGRQIYMACMQRAAHHGRKATRRRRHR